MHRWLRVLICLLLVCCVLVNLSPLQAEAVSATAIACSVAIPVAVAIGFQALGVRQGSDSSAFNNVVSSAVDALSSEWAVNGLSTMLAVTSDGLTKTYLSKNFLQSILDYLFSSKILIDGIDLSSKYPDLTDDILDFAQSYPYYVIFINEWGKFQVFCNSDGFELVRNVVFYESTNSYYVNKYQVKALGSGKSLNANDHSVWDNLSSGGFGSLLSKGSYSVNPDSLVSYDIVESAVNAIISTSEDLTLESVGHDIETDYETYVDTGIVGIDFGVQFEDDPNTNRNEEDDGNDLWLPVGIPGQLSGGSYIDQTQQDAQSGNTPQDVLDELLQNSGSGDGTGDGTGSDSGSGNSFGNTWKPPSDHNKFALADLSKFFPFCIPFDLYDFFTLLNAEPVAPVLSWEIKDLAGQTYSLDVDLSQWDSVALLFRRLQLFLFITGLAAASRKFIKW